MCICALDFKLISRYKKHVIYPYVIIFGRLCCCNLHLSMVYAHDILLTLA